MNPEEIISRRIRQARGEEEADLVIKKAAVFYLSSGELRRGDIAVCGDTIVGVDDSYHGKIEFDASGLTAVPGFIDSHVHIESTCLTPWEYERAVLPHGVTSAVCDPHELANVAGAEALKYFSDCASGMIMDLRIRFSSCVPASPWESPGARLSAESLRSAAGLPQLEGLAEVMDFPGVLACKEDLLDKLSAFSGSIIDGHCPMLSGKDLNAYLSSGISTCHETDSLDEAFEKLRKGMGILIREGSAGRNLDTLAPLITIENSPFLAFCTDDRSLQDILEKGHIDYMIRRAIALGADPLAVYRAASFSAGPLCGLSGRGLIAPGYKADIVLLSYLDKCDVRHVFKNGRPVEESLFSGRTAEPDASHFHHSVHSRLFSPADFRILSKTARTHVIGLLPGSLITEHLQMDLPRSGSGEKTADPDQDLAKAAVVERHGGRNHHALGFVRGTGLKSGAVASSIGHDSHNLCVCGVDDEDMALALNCVIEMQGGFAVAAHGRILSSLPLPVGGLMTGLPFIRLAEELRRIRQALRSLRAADDAPDLFQQLSFLPLTVIPHLKLSDQGLVDVDQWKLLYEES